jgi:aryl-alcohol dehydrogenase-like predicted oxidoreductase
MKYKTVPAMPSVNFSTIGFGCWALGKGSGWRDSSNRRSIAAVHKALDCGVTFFDTAPIYGFGVSESLLGVALKGRRNEITLASKCGLVWDESKAVRRDLSYSAVRADVEASLRRLQSDHLDVLQLHWPDHATSLEETARALQELIKEGKIKAVGVSNFSLSDTRALAALIPLGSYQGLYNMLERNPDRYHDIPLEYRAEEEILPYCLEKGMAFLPYSPLFQGLLTGSFKADSQFGKDDIRSANPKLSGPAYATYFATCEELKKVATEAGISMTHLALAWLWRNLAVTSILCGVQRPEQIADNAKAADVVLTDDVLNNIEQILRNHNL